MTSKRASTGLEAFFYLKICVVVIFPILYSNEIKDNLFLDRRTEEQKIGDWGGARK